MTRVRGYCPMGCGQTLSLGASGYVMCSFLPCPRPDAVSAILRDTEHEHIVDLTTDGFAISHPLRERLDDALVPCGLHTQLDEFQFVAVFEPGRYRVEQETGTGMWIWTALDVAEVTNAG